MKKTDIEQLAKYVSDTIESASNGQLGSLVYFTESDKKDSIFNCIAANHITHRQLHSMMAQFVKIFEISMTQMMLIMIEADYNKQVKGISEIDTEKIMQQYENMDISELLDILKKKRDKE